MALVRNVSFSSLKGLRLGFRACAALRTATFAHFLLTVEHTSPNPVLNQEKKGPPKARRALGGKAP